MPTPTIFEGINPRGTQTLIPCKDAKAQNGVIANTKLIKDTVGWSGKNKIWADYYDGKSKTLNGITATVNSDGSVTVNGTATGTFGFVIFQVRPSEFHKKFKVGDKCTILGCPANGSAFTYYLRLATDPWAILGDDYGESKEITITDQSSKTWVKLAIGIDSGQTMNNVTFYPMICDTNILDKTFESPFSSTAFPRSEQAVLGAKQWFDPNTVFVGNDYLFVTNSGKNIKIKNDVAISYCNGRFRIKTKPNTDYKLTTNIVVTSGVGMITVKPSDDSTDIVASNQYSTSGACTLSFNSGNNSDVIIRLFSTAGTSGTGEVSYDDLLLSLASDTDRTWVPYAMTNEQLTEKKLDKALAVVSGVSFNTLIETGFYFCNGSMTDNPGFNYGWLEVYATSTGAVKQIFYPIDNADIILSRRLNATWSSWYKFQGTVVS